MALKDYTGRTNKFQNEISNALKKGFDFIEFRQAYHGSLNDGRWWDTILISWAILESEEDQEKVRPIVENRLQKGVQPNGEIEYGYIFDYALMVTILIYYCNCHINNGHLIFLKQKII